MIGYKFHRCRVFCLFFFIAICPAQVPGDINSQKYLQTGGMSKWPSPPGSCTRTSNITCSHLKSAPAPQKLLRCSLSILLCFLPIPHSTNLWFWQFHLVFLNPSSFYPASFHSLTLQELPTWTFYLWNLCSLPFPNPSLVQLSQWLYLLFNNYIKLIGSIHSALVSLFLVWFYFSLSLETFQVYKKLKEWIFKYHTRFTNW